MKAMKAMHTDKVDSAAKQHRKEISHLYSLIAAEHRKLQKIYSDYNWSLHEEGAVADENYALKQARHWENEERK